MSLGWRESGGKSSDMFEEHSVRPPHQYLLRLRVNVDAHLLVETRRTIAAIAQDCGFDDQAHLYRSFRGIMNLTSSAFRSSQKDD